jgi:hypothetical protein
MSASTPKLRGRGGRYTAQPRTWPVFLLVPIVGFMVYAGSLTRHAAAEVPPAACAGSCDLTDPETKEKAAGVKFHEIGGPMDTLRNVCAAKGLADDEKCPKVLAAMARQESTFGKYMIGDGGHSVGWFQINNRWHKVSRDCAMDLVCSADYTLDYLLENGYLKNWKIAVMAHNGTPGIPATQKYLAKVTGYMVSFVPTIE